MNGLTTLTPFSTNGIGFLLITAAIVLFAWSSWRHHFVWAVLVAGAMMALTWVRPLDLLVLLIFLFIPYLTIKSRWGRGELAGLRGIVTVLVLQLIAFMIVKRYPWLDISGSLDHPVLVVGVSYILFRQVHLLVDAPYFKGTPINMQSYLAYLLSPWTLIAGPIQQYEDFFEGLKRITRPSKTEVMADLHRIVNGLIKAFVIAPLFLPASEIGLLTHPEANWADFLIVLYSYPIYLYFNFSGYVDIVIGAAKLCGFDTLPENFNRPYLARNIQDFWARWHMSLGVWIRRYVFIPLSAWLMKQTSTRWYWVMIALTVLVTFYLVGIWHGTTTNFIVFGMLHGVGILIWATFDKLLAAVLKKSRHKALKDNKFVYVFSTFTCFHFVCLTFLFLENSVGEVLTSFRVYFLG